MLTLKLITNDPQVAAYAVANGVGRIMVDIERLGKAERQAGRSTVISDHQIADVGRIRAVLPGAELLLRVNPWHAESVAEIRAGIGAGASLIMLPMARHEDEVAAAAAEASRHGVGIVPLVETTQAMVRLHRIVQVPGVREIYLGLNDLHLGLGLDFMFEPVASGLLDHLAAVVRASGLPFGFGGVATVGGGHIPAELVLAEHVRLGSRRVILSRAFSQGAVTVEDFKTRIDLPAQIARLQAEYARLTTLTPDGLLAQHAILQERVHAQVTRIRSERGRC